MKISNPKTFNRFILVVWLLLWFNMVTQYKAFMPLWIACLASAGFFLCASPFVTYLSTVLLRKAARTQKWGAFTVQFIVFSIFTGIILYGCISFFSFMEDVAIFPSSYFNDDYISPAEEFVNLFLSAIMFNFGFCGLRFIEVNIGLQKELHESQLQTLSGQINPHSMFNILNHIHVLLEKDPVAADELLLKYSDILRYQLYNANSGEVSVKQESEYMRQYVEVEKVRWKNKITVTQKWDIEREDMRIPPLLFISFLENAFKHVARSDSDKGYVDIVFSQKADSISFRVENSKSKLTAAKKRNEGLGLPNVSKRLKILYPSSHRLQITDSDHNYCVNLTIDNLK